MCSANGGESQTMYKYELGVCVCVACCLNSTYSTTAVCVCTFSVFVNSSVSMSVTYMANVL